MGSPSGVVLYGQWLGSCIFLSGDGSQWLTCRIAWSSLQLILAKNRRTLIGRDHLTDMHNDQPQLFCFYLGPRYLKYIIPQSQATVGKLNDTVLMNRKCIYSTYTCTAHTHTYAGTAGRTWSFFFVKNRFINHSDYKIVTWTNSKTGLIAFACQRKY